jgi:hypothetical protein
MTMKNRFKIFYTITIVSISLSLMTCKKDINVPTQDLEKLFGKWTLLSSGGGSNGQFYQSDGSVTIEFYKNGICKTYKNGKQTDKMKFTLSEGPSIFTSGTAYLINYKDIGLFHKNDNHFVQSIWFQGQDTLDLNEECFDCFAYRYIRKQ